MILTPAEFRQAGVVQSTWVLLRLRWTIFMIGFRRANRLRKLITIAITLISLAGVGFLFFLSWLFLGMMNRPEITSLVGDSTGILQALPNLLITGAFFGILITSFGVLLQALYLAGDMDFLLCRPVPIRAVFLAKLLQAVLPAFILVSAFALPVLFGFGLAQGYNLVYFPLVIIELVLFTLAAAGIASLMVMAVVRFIPARRVAEVLGFIGATASFLCSQSGQIARWENLSGSNARQYLAYVDRLQSPLSPFYWVGSGLVSTGTGHWAPGLSLVSISVLLTAGIFIFSLVLAENLYYSGWANLHKGSQKSRRVRQDRRRILFTDSLTFRKLISPAVTAIAIKDWTVLRRDIRNMSQLVTPLIFGIIYAFMFMRSGSQLPAGRGEAPAWFLQLMGNFRIYTNIALSLFVGWMLLGRLAGMAFSQEGRNYWLIKTSPIKPAELLAAKFLVSYLPVLALGWGFLAVIMLIQSASWSRFLYSLPVVAVIIAGNAGINLAFGIAGARLDWEDPRQMQRGGISCLSSLVTMAYLGISLVIFLLLPLGLQVVSVPETLAQLLGMLVGIPFCLGCAIIPLLLTAKRLPALGEAAS